MSGDGARPGRELAGLDHLVLGAASLESGGIAFERRAGVRLPPGGAHPRMGTHNRLTRLGDDGAFLELIAIDPAAPAPARPRWFGLDEPDTAERVAEGFALLTWVVAVADLDAALDRARAAGVDAGRAIEQERGELRWRIALPEDGSRVEGGVFPALIEWPPGTAAASRIADLGLRLRTLRLTHPEPERLEGALAAVGAAALADVAPGPRAIAATLSLRGREIDL